MNIIIPLQNIRKKENNKRKIERNKIQRDQQNLLQIDNYDTSSDYNSNFIDFPKNEIPIYDIKKIRYFNENQITEKTNLIKGTNLSISPKIFNSIR